MSLRYELERALTTLSEDSASKASQGDKAPPVKKWTSAGGVVLAGSEPSEMTKVWIRKSKANPGYPAQWSFAKGRVDDGESREQAAQREVEEELGLRTTLLRSGYLGVFEGGFSKTHYFLMIAKGAPGKHDAETEKVALLSWEEAMGKFAKSGNKRDVDVALKAVAHINQTYGIDPYRGVELPSGE